MNKQKYITKLDKIDQLTQAEREKLATVGERFAFRTNDYYNSLINWDDPEDPIRRIVIPDVKELDEGGRLDASFEESYTMAQGLQHKYTYTALLLVNDICGGYCRFCFRKRLFMNSANEVPRDVSEGLEYIRQHSDLNNILLTGGDPLLLSTDRLEKVIRELRSIDHVKIIRIGSKIPAFNPYRIIDDPSLAQMLGKYSDDNRKIYLMAHFNHPGELTKPARQAMTTLMKSGVVTVNQTPLLKGVNDDPRVLGELFNELAYIGVAPYYLFQCRPTMGNKMFSVPLEKGFEIFEQARMLCSGTAKRARYVMSHSTGKLEIVGRTCDHVYMRYHRAADPQKKARFMVYKSNPEAYWLDDYEEVIADYSIDHPYRCYGPE